MTTPNTTGFRLPDPPERGADEFTRARHLFMTGSAHHLVRHLGSPETTLVSADLYITQVPRSRQDGRIPGPDLLVAFGQNLCKPLSPHCSICPIATYCDRVGVKRSR